MCVCVCLCEPLDLCCKDRLKKMIPSGNAVRVAAAEELDTREVLRLISKRGGFYDTEALLCGMQHASGLCFLPR